jgi:phosphatidylinositol alpha 1,6-mannosyltransferase
LNEETLRVAFFPDTFHEVDGVANTSRQYRAFAQRRALPFLTVYGGAKDEVRIEGSGTTVELGRGPVGFAVDKKHHFDLAFCRHYRAAEEAVQRFAPDIVHITGPSDVGILGALLAHRLHIPLAASWHTNLHQYAEERASSLVPWLPQRDRERLGAVIRRGSLLATLRFYKLAQILYAPNQELIDLLERGTGKPCYLMQRGVDTSLFDSKRRDRSDDTFVIGYAGRLTIEKNIRFLAAIERALEGMELNNFRFLIVGQGAEEAWLKANMRHADFTGVLQGEALAKAYANMDVFAFPSRTDTFGNVVLEALASGVPAVVTDSGGPQFIVRPCETGFVARNVQEFARCILDVAGRQDLLESMRISARNYAIATSWDQVFEAVYAGYERGLKSCAAAGKRIRVRPGSAVCAGGARLG